MKVARPSADIYRLRTDYQLCQVQLEHQLDDLRKDPQTYTTSSGNDQLRTLQTGIDEMEQLRAELDQNYTGLDLPEANITADTLHAMGFDDWVRMTSADLKRPYGEKDQVAYENFIQGYLYYFERNINQNDTGEAPREYTIYFDWGKTRGDSALVVYIKPALDLANYNDYPRNVLATSNGNGQPKTLDLAGTGHGKLSPFPPPPSMTDPVKPPPPPPPTQR
jgi:hypothetical protein